MAAFFKTTVLLPAHLIKHLCDLLPGSRCQQTDNDIEDTGDNKSGQQFIDIEGAAQLCDAEFPDKDHDAAGDHASQSAPFVGAPPEQREEDNGAEGRAEARPGEGYDPEHGAVRISCQKDTDHGDGDDSDPRDRHRRFVFQLDAEEVLHDILRDAGGRGQKLGVRGGHRGGENAGHNNAGDQRREDTEIAQITGDPDDDRLGIFEGGEDARLCHAVADDADQHGHRHGDDHPYGGDSSG